jgi:hypothetical protein
VLWIAALAAFFVVQIVRAQFADFGGGALIIDLGQMLVAALIGFAAGFYWSSRPRERGRRGSWNA